MQLSILKDFIMADESQNECLQELVDKRNGSLEMYQSRGIIYIPPVEQADEWAYLCEQTGFTPADFGVVSDNRHLLDDGFMLPVTDSDNNILFYLNHNFDRDASLKYINVNTPLAPQTDATKLYGLHNVELALKYDTIFVLEGYFDALRLEMEGFPTSAPLGTKIMPYHVNFYSRFRRVVYIEDNDLSGEYGYKKFKEKVPHAVNEKMPAGFKDVDKLAEISPAKFQLFVNYLRKYLLAI